jgi:hypothetical protein
MDACARTKNRNFGRFLVTERTRKPYLRQEPVVLLNSMFSKSPLFIGDEFLEFAEKQTPEVPYFKGLLAFSWVRDGGRICLMIPLL